MIESLHETQRRVLGVLLEKSMAQPAYYPMTIAAIVAACNQKSNRDPVLELDEDTVWDTLEQLRQLHLATKLMPSGSARTERFKHEAQSVFGWEKPQRAVMTELLLRGPQTASELRSRCQRMYAFENNEAVSAVLEGLQGGERRFVEMLARQPGQSAVRFAHCLYGPGELDRATASSAIAAAAAPAAAQGGADDGAAPARRTDEVAALDARVHQLQEALAALTLRVQELEQAAR